MATLGRRIGLGLAARGEVDDVVRWAREARRQGLDSVWIHDSYYERDAVSYVSAIACELGEDEREDGFRIALGAVNPFTRHPVVLAMTGSALDEMAPGRIVMGTGHRTAAAPQADGHPVRARHRGRGRQRARSTRSVRCGRASGSPSATPGLPPIQPMFAPPHRIPLYIAAYRKEFVALAGQKADGYLARPAESVPSLAGSSSGLHAAATAAGRDPAAVETAGYLLSLVDETRREALNRAKREPFVIYMMSVLGDVSLARAGFDRELRDRIAAAWRAEDFHTAGNLIPDELLDAFMLCGTRRGRRRGRDALPHRGEPGAAAAPAGAPGGGTDRRAAGRGQALRRDARLRGRCAEAAARVPVLSTAGAAARAASGHRRPMPSDIAGYSASAGLADDRALTRRLAGPAPRRRDLGGPAAVRLHRVGHPGRGGWCAGVGRRQVRRWSPFVLALIGGVALHSGTNVINEIYDVRQGVDTITSPRASHAILKGRINERDAFARRVALLRPGRRRWPRACLAAWLADRRARAGRPRRRLLLHGAAVPVQVPRARACRWCSC